ncbi:hypothetical protein Agub_g6919 [Astrephomene gubernaculifera]|uniref:BHLH domain-containing protein n=1 Tax=Astrephomene gubernaculifera TaxID=47775 RepID=A0AAD3DTE1_9CHLO|nr:hypothetical protein Agub_g6919 [Astrephomene gubernaculifera]
MKAVSGHSPQAQLQALASSGGTEDAVTLNSSFLEFLNDELVFGSEVLDAPTLEAVCKVADGQRQVPCGRGDAIKPSLSAAQPGPSVQPTSTQAPKRSQEDAGLSDSDEDDEPSKGEKSSGKRSRGGELSAAATKKACREKARREKLNERFLDLARLVDPNSEPKTDKSTILTDAIKYVQQLTVENHQLRQLNKFLEERVSTLERERGQQLYQQSLMMNAMGPAPMMAAGQPMLVGGAAGMLAGPSAGMQGAPMGHPLPAANMASTSGALLASSSMPSTSTPPLSSLSSQQQQQHPHPHSLPHAHAQQSGPGGLMVHAHQGGVMMAHGPGPMLAQTQGGLLAQQAGGGMMMQASNSMMAQGPGSLLAQSQCGMMTQGSGGVMSQAPGGLLAQASGPMMVQLPGMSGGSAAAAGVGMGGGPMNSVAAASGVTFLGGGSGAGPSKPIVVNSRPGIYPGMYWLPPQLTDSTQDSLLRPPAA